MVEYFVLSVIYSIRDRDPNRLIESIHSLKQYDRGYNVEYLVIDYGSKLEYQKKIANLCKKEEVRIIRSETQGFPWNKSQALNIGAVHAKGEYILTTDIDMIFADNVFKACMKYTGPSIKIHCRPLWLPKSGKLKNAWHGDNAQLGGLLFLRKHDFIRDGGFNEDIELWGNEDIELNLRLTNKGYKTIWIDSEIKMYHTCHPVSYGMFSLVPDVIKVQQEKEVIKAIFGDSQKSSNSIGRITTEVERPILNYIDEGNFNSYNVLKNRLCSEIDTILEISTSNRLLRIDIGDYFPHNRNIFGSEKKMFWTIKILTKILFRCGYDVSAQRNNNLNQFLLMKSHLIDRGLLDYYISDDLSTIYLLFNYDK